MLPWRNRNSSCASSSIWWLCFLVEYTHCTCSIDYIVLIFVIGILLCNMVLLDFCLFLSHTSAVSFSGKCLTSFFLFLWCPDLEPLGWILMLADNYAWLCLYSYSFTQTGIDSGRSIFIKSWKLFTTAYPHCLKITSSFHVTINKKCFIWKNKQYLQSTCLKDCNKI